MSAPPDITDDIIPSTRLSHGSTKSDTPAIPVTLSRKSLTARQSYNLDANIHDNKLKSLKVAK